MNDVIASRCSCLSLAPPARAGVAAKQVQVPGRNYSLALRANASVGQGTKAPPQ